METITYDIEAQVGEAHWWFQARRRILQDVLQHLPLPARPTIYDLGCGTGHNLIMLQELGEATGIDMSADALAYCRSLGCRSTLEGNLYDLPLADEAADVVVASDILEHLDDDARGAAEIRRVLKQDSGVAVITVPAFQWLWGTQDDVSHHKRRYTKGELVGLLERAGLELERATYFNFFLFPAVLGGRTLLRLKRGTVESENTLTPGWSNGLLRTIFASEAYWLRVAGFPVGVSILAVAKISPVPGAVPAAAAAGTRQGSTESA
jgi:SAM-dependent methyltransferase